MGWEYRVEWTGTSGHSAHKTRLNSAPGIFAYITRAVPEIKLHSTSARAAEHVPAASPKCVSEEPEPEWSTHNTAGPSRPGPLHDGEQI